MVHLLDRELPDVGGVAGDSGVVDQDVDAAPGVDGRLNAALDYLRVAHVAHLEPRVDAAGGQLGDRSFAQGAVEVDDQQPGALPAQPGRYAEADAGGAARDYRDLFIEAGHASPFENPSPCILLCTPPFRLDEPSPCHSEESFLGRTTKNLGRGLTALGYLAASGPHTARFFAEFILSPVEGLRMTFSSVSAVWR